MSQRWEQTSERTSKWPSTYIGILGCSEPLCMGASKDDSIGAGLGFVIGAAMARIRVVIPLRRQYPLASNRETAFVWKWGDLNSNETWFELWFDFKTMYDNGSFKKKCQQNCSSVFCWSLLLFYSDTVHKQWLKMWFLTSQMPVLSSVINFVPFWITSKNHFSIIPMKYSKNGQKFAMSNMLFETCWTVCKKPHFSTRSRLRYTFFLMTRYWVIIKKFSIGIFSLIKT